MCTVLGGASTGGVKGADGADAGDGAEGGSLGALIRNRSVDGKAGHKLAHKLAQPTLEISEARQAKCLSGFNIGTAGFEPATP